MNEPAVPFTSQPAFRWICFGTAVVFATCILKMVYDIKLQMKQSLDTAHQAVEQSNQAITTVNEQLPAIVTEVKKGTGTLADLSEDVKLIKDIAGVTNENKDRGLRGLANYANEVQKVLEEKIAGKNAVMMIEKVIGTSLKETMTADEFLVGLHKEMVTLILPLSKSREEMLWRITVTAPRRVPYYVKFPDEEPVKLEQFLREHHQASAELPVYDP